MILKIKLILKNKKGNGAVFACFIVLSLMLVTTVVCEYLRQKTIVEDVRDGLQAAVTATVTDNYDDVYNGVRQGYTGGYELSSSNNWRSKIDTGNIYIELDNRLGLEEKGVYHVKRAGYDIEYKISNLNVQIQNNPLAPEDTEVNKFLITGNVRLEIPIGFGWDMIEPLKINLEFKSGYTEKH